MKTLSKSLLAGAALSFAITTAATAETIIINPTDKTALLDGKCGNDEWDVATQIDLPSEVSIYRYCQR